MPLDLGVNDLSQPITICLFAMCIVSFLYVDMDKMGIN
jgi:hypothetical protein